MIVHPFLMISFVVSLLSLFFTNIFLFWCCLELSTLAFVLSSSTHNLLYVNNPLLPFLLVQGAGALVLFAGGILDNPSLMLVSIMLKLGMYPFHFWLLPVLSFMPLLSFYFATVVLKLPLLLLVPTLPLSSSFYMVLSASCLISVLMGGAGGVGTSNFMFLMCWSSLMHSGWMTLVALSSPCSLLIYMAAYSMFLFPLIVFLFRHMTLSPPTMLSLPIASSSVSLSLVIVNMSGMPPTGSFFLKWFALTTIASSSGLIACMGVLFSVISAWWYLFWCYQSLMNR